MDDTNTILFQDYLDAKLTTKAKAAFEQRLAEDATFAAHFETYKELHAHFENQFSQERIDFEQTLSQVGGHFIAEISTPKKETKVIRFRPWQYGIAASMALLIGFYIFQNSGSPALEDYVFSERISLTERSENTTTKLAETTFNKGSYTEAILHFTRLLQEDPSNTEYQFYKAVAHDALDQFEESTVLFTNLSQGTSIYQYKATYYGAISQWKRGYISEAKKLLKSIPESASEYKKAKKLLKKL